MSVFLQIAMACSVLGLAVGTGCGGPVTFKEDIWTMMQRDCASCHTAEMAVTIGSVLVIDGVEETFQRVMENKPSRGAFENYARPYDQNSFLYEKGLSPDDDIALRFPWEDLYLLREWIDAGCLWK